MRFEEAKKTGTLDLPVQKLRKIPPEVFDIKNLQALDLSENRLTAIPKEIAELKNLHTVYLYENQNSGDRILILLRGEGG